MKINIEKNKLTLSKTEKSKLKTTARKTFTSQSVKEGLNKTDNEGVKSMALGATITSQAVHKGTKAAKHAGKVMLTTKQILMYLKKYDQSHPGREILKGLSQGDQEKLAGKVLKQLNKEELIKGKLADQWMEKKGKTIKVSSKSSIPIKKVSITQNQKGSGSNGPMTKGQGVKQAPNFLQKIKMFYGKAYGKMDKKLEKKIVSTAQNITKKNVYRKHMAKLNLVKSTMMYTAGEEEGTNIIKSAVSLLLNPIVVKLKIKILAVAGWLLLPLIFLLLPILLILLLFSAGASSQMSQSASLSPQVEAWRPTVQKYCDKYKIGDYTDLALALMMQESGGNEPDPLQAAEGSYGLYCLKTKNNNGGHSHSPNGIPTGHGECSINAGVQELRDALKAAKVEDPYDIGRIMVALQGYNYGMSGWIKWINEHGGVYTLALSQEYSRTKMPAGAKGTPEHAQLVMRYYTYNDVGGTTMVTGNGGVDVVYYSQADPRWGEVDFGGSKIKDAGCGPTSMAICISTLTDKKVNPVTTCKWAAQHGYYVKGSGWSHSVVAGLAKHYKLKCKAIGKNRTELIKALKKKKLVVAIMGPGHFTKKGHYIVLRGMDKKGRILVADCGKKSRNKAWDFDIVYNEARPDASAGGPFWVISK